MIVKNQYPICEFDTNKNPIIHPTNFLTENLPKKCVITYLRQELEHFCKENKLFGGRIGKPKVAICPKCGEVSIYVEDVEKL